MIIFSKIKNRRGMTLIEVIIGVGIAMLIFAAITAIYQISQNAYSRADRRAEITQNGRVILDRLVRELRQTPAIVTTLPETAADPANLPHEIMFQDGHTTTEVRYIKYYLDGTNIKKQVIIYYFSEDPSFHVYWHDTDEDGNPPLFTILEDKVVGEFVDDIEFWGEKLININLYLLKNNESEIIYTAVYGRNF